jgi:aryl-alcohol dehydrogenase-like predicted oxidoreductase
MKQRTIGGQAVSAIGLGGMPMTIEGRPDARRSIATIYAALDAGVTLLDRADAYHRDVGEVGQNEELIVLALRAYGRGPDDVLVATKGGHQRPGSGGWTVNGDPAHLKQAAKESAKRVGVEAIGLYKFHRPDPSVPYADSIGAIRDLLDEGVILMAGISNAPVDQSTRPTRSWAVGSRRSRTSSRPGSAPACASWSAAPSWASRSCRGARWAASRTRPNSRRTTPLSARSRTR